MADKVIVYSTPLCAPCEQVKAYLRRHGVDFVVKDLLMDEDAEDPRWIIDWVQGHLDGTERQLLAGLESRFDELPA